MRRGASFAALVACLLLAAGCGPKAITVGSRPFPAGHPVFTDSSGKTLEALPDADGAVRLVFLEFPWCTACQDVWRAIRIAATPLPPGTLRIYRVLFDRETELSAAGRKEVPPRYPAPILEGDVPEEPGALEVTTLTALPDAFRNEFRVSNGPLLLLLDTEGKVERRWIGFSPGMSLEISSDIRRRFPVLSPRPPGT